MIFNTNNILKLYFKITFPFQNYKASWHMVLASHCGRIEIVHCFLSNSLNRHHVFGSWMHKLLSGFPGKKIL